uniref:Uncharacterized protein n=1 Tax=Amphimedon queenslandica TaxID=400682 RepID=A0A1X7VXS8_AMPQE
MKKIRPKAWATYQLHFGGISCVRAWRDFSDLYSCG